MNIDEIMCQVDQMIQGIFVEDMADGADDYAWVRVYPSGLVGSGREPSWCVGEDEYYGRVPHPITVWSTKGLRPPVGADDGVFCWEDSLDGEYIRETDSSNDYEVVNQMSEESLVQKISEGWIRFTLDRTSSGLVENLDLDDILRDIETEVEKWIEEGNLVGVAG
jgi:hypothetical protein